MKRITQFKQLQILIVALLFSCFSLYAQVGVGIGTTNPANQFQMVNTGEIGVGNHMADFVNSGVSGGAVNITNTGLTNGLNAFEGLTYGTFSGVYGLAVSNDIGNVFDATGTAGHSNDWQGIGILGSRTFNAGLDTGFGGLFIADIGFTGGIFNVSDRRLKTNIEPINGALTTISELEPVTYLFNKDKYPNLGLNSTPEYGFIAQDIEAVLPYIVKDKRLPVNAGALKGNNDVKDDKIESFKMVNYVELIPILTKGIQEQQQIIEDQNKRIKSLERKLGQLEDKINELLKNKN